MSAKHTPGPWKAHFEEAYFVTGPDLGRVAMMMNLKGALGLGGRPSGAESAADCLLIAAAPELLDSSNALLFVVRALAKELGIDPETTEFRFSANGKHIADFTLATCYERAESVIAKATGEQP